MRLKFRRGAWIFAPLLIVASIFSGQSTHLAKATDNCDTVYSESNFTLGGTATQSSGTIQLTPAQGGRFGAIWNKSRVNLSSDFCVIADVYLGNYDPGADRISFCYAAKLSRCWKQWWWAWIHGYCSVICR